MNLLDRLTLLEEEREERLWYDRYERESDEEEESIPIEDNEYYTIRQ